MENKNTLDLEDFYQVFSKYWFVTIIITFVFIVIGLILVNSSKNIYQSQVTIYSKGFQKGFSDEGGYDTLAISRLPVIYKEASLRMIQEDFNKGILNGNYDLNLKIQKQLDAINKNTDYTATNDSTESYLEKLIYSKNYSPIYMRRNIQVNFVGKSQIVEMTYSGKSPEKVAQALNTLAKIFVARYNEIYGRKVADMIISQLETEKIEVEQEVHGYAKSLHSINAILTEKGKQKNFISIQKIKKNPQIQQLENELKKAQDQETRSRIIAAIDKQLPTIWEDENLEYIDPETKKLYEDKLKTELLYAQSVSRRDVLSGKIEYYRQQTLTAIPKALEIINYAEVPTRRVSQFGSIHILLLALVGFFISNWVIFGLENYNAGLKIAELEEKTQKKVLGMIPAEANKHKLDKELAFLSLTLKRKNLQTILFSSVRSDSGKTFLSESLGSYLSKNLHKKVILVDLHSNRALSKFFQVENQIGISDYLLGSELNIQTTNIKNLNIVPFGSMSPESFLAGLTEYERLTEGLKNLAKQADYIVLDGSLTGNKFLDFIPELAHVFIIQDGRKSLSFSEITIFKNYEQRIAGLIVNFANNNQVKEFYGQEEA